jgi:hypothetical protein
MSFPNTTANEVYLIAIVVIAWVMTARALAKPRTDPWAWITVASCFAVILYVMYITLKWTGYAA